LEDEIETGKRFRWDGGTEMVNTYISRRVKAVPAETRREEEIRGGDDIFAIFLAKIDKNEVTWPLQRKEKQKTNKQTKK
jgi:hypothetical protein